MHRENLKFTLASQMQSIASYILNTLLDKRFANQNINETFSSSNCRSELLEVSSAALRNEHWALSVFDSNGRIRSGLIEGSLFNSVGDYEQCLASESKHGVAAFKHCLIHFDISNEAQQFALLTKQPINLFRSEPVKFGICAPKICEVSEIKLLANQVLSYAQLSSIGIKQIDCDLEVSPVWFRDFGLLTCFIMIITLFSLITASSCLGLSSMNKRNFSNSFSWFYTFLDKFSLPKTYEALRRKRSHSNEDYLNLRVLDGVRVISMIWIIIIHSYNFAFDWLLFDNTKSVKAVYKFIWVQWIANGTYSVDNFFIISGFLAYLNYNQITKTTKRKLSESSQLNTNLSSISISLARVKEAQSRLINRYLRLIPTLLFMIMLSVNILPHLTTGFKYSTSTMMFENWCRNGWYINLFMLQNFINTPNMCFSHSWFVSVDFQLFIILNLLLLVGDFIMYHFKKNINVIKWSASLTMTFAQLAVVYMIFTNDLTSIPLIPNHTIRSLTNYYALIYIKPYYWIFSYMIGVLLANCLTSKKFLSRTSANLTPIVILLLQSIPILLMIALLLSTLPYFQGALTMSTLQASILGLLVRPTWSLSLACLLFFFINQDKSISRSYCRPVKLLTSILSSDIWLPLSRLTYAAYLIHPVVMAIFYGSRRETFQFSHALLIYFTLGHLILTYTGAFIIYLTVEVPCRGLIELASEAISRKKVASSKVQAAAAANTTIYPERINLSSLPDGSR